MADRHQEIADRLFFALVFAKEPRVVVIGIRVVGIQPEGTLERLLGEVLFAQVAVDETQHVVGGRVARVSRGCGARFRKRHAEVPSLEVCPGKLGVNTRALPRAGHFPDDGSAIGLAGQVARERPSGAVEKHRCAGEHCCGVPRSIQGPVPSRRAGLRVRSWIFPASCPHAASISSPRVLRVVVTIPDAPSTSLNRSITRRGERTKPEFGNGLNGIRLILHGTRETKSTSWRACSSVSLTPSSMTYSKVMKSRGARSRYRRHTASNSASGYLRLMGMSVSRSASFGACKDTASATGHSAARRSIIGTIPDVESVTRRRESPYASSSIISFSAETVLSKLGRGSPRPTTGPWLRRRSPPGGARSGRLGGQTRPLFLHPEGGGLNPGLPVLLDRQAGIQ